jgi:hypothetical protein
MESRACASEIGVHAVILCSISAMTCSSPMLLDAVEASVSGVGSSGTQTLGAALLQGTGGQGDNMSVRSCGSVDSYSRAIMSDSGAEHASTDRVAPAAVTLSLCTCACRPAGGVYIAPADAGLPGS